MLNERPARRQGELRLVRENDDALGVLLQPPRLEPLSAAEEREAVELLAALLVEAVRRRSRPAERLGKAA